MEAATEFRKSSEDSPSEHVSPIAHPFERSKYFFELKSAIYISVHIHPNCMSLTQ